MGHGSYNPFEGILRLAIAGDKKPDPFVTEVLVFHAALEQEIDEFLSKLLPRPEKLFQRPGQFGFQNKVTVLAAAWVGDGVRGDRLCATLIRFNDLRNAVVHSDQKDGRDKALSNLRRAYRLMQSDDGEGLSVTEMAVGICLSMGQMEDAAAELSILDKIAQTLDN